MRYLWRVRIERNVETMIYCTITHIRRTTTKYPKGRPRLIIETTLKHTYIYIHQMLFHTHTQTALSVFPSVVENPLELTKINLCPEKWKHQNRHYFIFGVLSCCYFFQYYFFHSLCRMQNKCHVTRYMNIFLWVSIHSALPIWQHSAYKK